MKRNSIYNMDALDLLGALQNGEVQVVVTSPPYNMGERLKNRSRYKKGDNHRNDGYDNYHDSMPAVDYIKWQRTCLSEMMRVIHPTGAVFYVHKWRSRHHRLDMLLEITDGFPIRQVIIWDKCNSYNYTPGNFMPTYEVVYMFGGPELKLEPGAARHGSVWRIPRVNGHTHPAAFPFDLPARAIDSIPRGLVVDPFCGSGTTLEAAHLLDREWIGGDISEKYCALSRDRIAGLLDWKGDYG